MSNLELWDSVSKTDPAFTKPAKKGQYNFTSITPVYQFKNATDMFGPQGIGWGVKIGSEVFQEKEYSTTIILSYDAILFYKWGGETGEIPIHASEKVCYQTQGPKGYMKIDDEARKKVVTNAKTKGLSELGFNADIFMKQFENQEYLNMINNEFALEKADNSSELKAQQDADYRGECIKQLDYLKKAKSTSELKGLYGDFSRRAGTRGDIAQQGRLDKVKTTMVEKLTTKN